MRSRSSSSLGSFACVVLGVSGLLQPEIEIAQHAPQTSAQAARRFTLLIAK
jgi:hypothetical protein